MICICFFGLTRSLQLTYPSISKQIFSVFKESNITWDTYVHTYNLRELTNRRSKEFQCALDPDEYTLLDPFREMVQNQDVFDKSITLETYKKHGDPWSDNYKSLRNLLRQLNSLQQVTNLWVSEGKQYDAVIYLRPDLYYVAPFPIAQLKECIEAKERQIYTPGWHKWKGLNDRLAMGKPEIMQIYGTRFSVAASYAAQKKLHAERFLAFVVSTNQIRDKPFRIYGNRVRANGEILKDVKSSGKR